MFGTMAPQSSIQFAQLDAHLSSPIGFDLCVNQQQEKKDVNEKPVPHDSSLGSHVFFFYAFLL